MTSKPTSQTTDQLTSAPPAQETGEAPWAARYQPIQCDRCGWLAMNVCPGEQHARWFGGYPRGWVDCGGTFQAFEPEAVLEPRRIAAYRQVRIWEPNMDSYNAAVSVYLAAFPEANVVGFSFIGAGGLPPKNKADSREATPEAPISPVCPNCGHEQFVHQKGVCKLALCDCGQTATPAAVSDPLITALREQIRRETLDEVDREIGQHLYTNTKNGHREAMFNITKRLRAKDALSSLTGSQEQK